MAGITDELRGLLVDRFSRNPGWFDECYRSALGRIEDHSAGDPPYWLAPDDRMWANAGHDEIVLDDGLSSKTSEEARRWAFEVLVLADIAEAHFETHKSEMRGGDE